MREFKSLKVWQLARHCALDIYRHTEGFPPSERYGLQSQLRRSSTSIMANIAEGCGHTSQREFRRFLRIARGSASEVESHLVLARDLNLLDHEAFSRISSNVHSLQRMLSAFMASL